MCVVCVCVCVCVACVCVCAGILACMIHQIDPFFYFSHGKLIFPFSPFFKWFISICDSRISGLRGYTLTNERHIRGRAYESPIKCRFFLFLERPQGRPYVLWFWNRFLLWHCVDGKLYIHIYFICISLFFCLCLLCYILFHFIFLFFALIQIFYWYWLIMFMMKLSH